MAALSRGKKGLREIRARQVQQAATHERIDFPGRGSISRDSTPISVHVADCRAASQNAAYRDGTRATRIIALLLRIPRIMPPRPDQREMGVLSPETPGNTLPDRTNEK
jgi:hypothetical protein